MRFIMRLNQLARERVTKKLIARINKSPKDFSREEKDISPAGILFHNANMSRDSKRLVAVLSL
tara:strand:+ start:297 stop:485 length:189 start_codon:yes stop_codon:yes gene_type:complete